MGTNCGVLAVTLLRHRASWVQTAMGHVCDVGSGVLMLLCIRMIWAINAPGTLNTINQLIIKHVLAVTYTTRKRKTDVKFSRRLHDVCTLTSTTTACAMMAISARIIDADR